MQATTVTTLTSYLNDIGPLRMGRLGQRIRVQQVLTSCTPDAPLESYKINEAYHSQIDQEVQAFDAAQAALTELTGMRLFIRIIRSFRLSFRSWWHNIEVKRYQLFYVKLFMLVTQNGEPTKDNAELYEQLFSTKRFSPRHPKFTKHYHAIKQYIINSIEKYRLHNTSKTECFAIKNKIIAKETTFTMYPAPTKKNVTHRSNMDTSYNPTLIKERLRTEWWAFLTGKCSYKELMARVKAIQDKLYKGLQDDSKQEANVVDKIKRDFMLQIARCNMIIDTCYPNCPTELIDLIKLHHETTNKIHCSHDEEELNVVHTAFNEALSKYSSRQEWDFGLVPESKEQCMTAVLSDAVTEVAQHFNKGYNDKMRQLRRTTEHCLNRLCKKYGIIKQLRNEQQHHLMQLRSHGLAFLLNSNQPQATIATTQEQPDPQKIMSAGAKISDEFFDKIKNIIEKELKKSDVNHDITDTLYKMGQNFDAERTQWEVILTQYHVDCPHQLLSLITRHNQAIVDIQGACDTEELEELYRNVIDELMKYKETHGFTLIPKAAEQQVASMLSPVVTAMQHHIDSEYNTKVDALKIRKRNDELEQRTKIQRKENLFINQLYQKKIQRLAQLHAEWWAFLVETKPFPSMPNLTAADDPVFRQLMKTADAIHVNFCNHAKQTRAQIEKQRHHDEKNAVVNKISGDFETEFMQWRTIAEASYSSCQNELLELIQLYNQFIIGIRQSHNKEELNDVSGASTSKLSNIEKKFYDQFNGKETDETSIAVLNAALAEVKCRFKNKYDAKFNELEYQENAAKLLEHACEDDSLIAWLYKEQLRDQKVQLYSKWWAFLVESKVVSDFQELIEIGKDISDNFFDHVQLVRRQRTKKQLTTVLDKINHDFETAFNAWQIIVKESSDDPSPLKELLEWYNSTIAEMQESPNKEALEQHYKKAADALLQRQAIQQHNVYLFPKTKEERVATMLNAALVAIKRNLITEYEHNHSKLKLQLDEYAIIDANKSPEQKAAAQSVVTRYSPSTTTRTSHQDSSLEDLTRELNSCIKQLYQDGKQQKAYTLNDAEDFQQRAQTDLASFKKIMASCCDLLAANNSASVYQAVLEQAKNCYFYMLKHYHENFYTALDSNSKMKVTAKKTYSALNTAWAESKCQFQIIIAGSSYAFLGKKFYDDWLTRLEQMADDVRANTDEYCEWSEAIVNEFIYEKDRPQFEAQLAAAAASDISAEPHKPTESHGELIALAQQQTLLLLDDKQQRLLSTVERFLVDFSAPIRLPQGISSTFAIWRGMKQLNKYRIEIINAIKDPHNSAQLGRLANTYREYILQIFELDPRITLPIVSALATIAEEHKKLNALVDSALNTRCDNLEFKIKVMGHRFNEAKTKVKKVTLFLKERADRLAQEKEYERQMKEEYIKQRKEYEKERKEHEKERKEHEKERKECQKQIKEYKKQKKEYKQHADLLQVKIASYKWCFEQLGLDSPTAKKPNTMKRSKSCANFSNFSFFQRPLTRSQSLLVLSTEKERYARTAISALRRCDK